MNKYKIIGDALEKLKEWELSCERDNGIRHLSSGGDTESINQWYAEMEAQRTPEQRWAEQQQKEAWNKYQPLRRKAIKLIKKAQKIKSYPTFGIPDYDGTWDVFKAPNQDIAQQFLQIRNDSITLFHGICKAEEIQPDLLQMSFS